VIKQIFSLQLKFPFWAATELETPTGVLKFPVPHSDKKINFWNSTGLSYQCKEVRRCIQAGLTESPQMSLDETLLLAEMREGIRKQIGVSYAQD
jgi:dihydrodiol dehydrogenase / D-xylose 1-dehydrogenase (NADP)